MIKILTPLPKSLTVALSGGVDSVAVADFLSRKHNISCAFFHHGTENSQRAFDFVVEFCNTRKFTLFVETIVDEKPKESSTEEHWRNERYKFLESLNTTVVTAHNLDDCVETYLYGALHGQPKVIPLRRNNIVRPFLTTPKKEFVRWCQKNEQTWCEDLSNQDLKYMRNYIRHQVMPCALTVNPGLHTVVKKIVEKKIKVPFV
jgi:tRNA(Ile)-lysidine synthetase-like protein